MLRVIQSPSKIYDSNLCARVWVNTSGEAHHFVTYLMEVYPRAENLVSDVRVIQSANGDRTLLPHAFYRHFTASGRPISHDSGRWELYRAEEHAGPMIEFLRRYFSN